MNCLVCPDESEFQPIITDKFGRRLLIIRVAFGAHYPDQHFLANTNVIAWLYKHGVIDGVILYQVYLATATPQEQCAFVWQLIGPTVPEWLIGVMLDVEAWRGTSYAISGNHSRPVNQLGGMHAHKLGSWSAVGIYGNRGDLAEIVPGRDPRFWVLVASYGPQLVYKSVKGAIGQQYTDGQAKYGVPSVGGQPLPLATSGVRCDHNVFDPARFPTAKALRNFMRPPVLRPPVKPPVTKPTTRPSAPAPHYRRATGFAQGIASNDGHVASIVTNDNKIQIWRDGSLVRSL